MPPKKQLNKVNSLPHIKRREFRKFITFGLEELHYWKKQKQQINNNKTSRTSLKSLCFSWCVKQGSTSQTFTGEEGEAAKVSRRTGSMKGDQGSHLKIGLQWAPAGARGKRHREPAQPKDHHHLRIDRCRPSLCRAAMPAPWDFSDSLSTPPICWDCKARKSSVSLVQFPALLLTPTGPDRSPGNKMLQSHFSPSL